MKTKWLVLLGFLAAIAMPSGAGELGDAAGPLQVSEWVKGEPADIAAGKGKNIFVVEFWATWCGPCRQSIPHLTELQKKFKDKGVVFIGVSDEDADTVKPFVEKMADKMEYRVALDSDGQTAAAYMKAFGQNGIPTAFVVDKEGRIAWVGHPMGGLEATLDQLAAGKFDLEAAKRAAKATHVAREYYALVSQGGDEAKAKEFGETVLRDGAGDAMLMNDFAWTILTDEGIPQRDLALAMRAAQAAYDACAAKDPNIVDTYARALFDTGKKAEAIEFEKKAIELATEPNSRAELQKTLDRYQAESQKK